MKINDIVAGVNTKLAGETLTYNQLRLFLDETIDIINRELNAEFPSFSTLDSNGTYDAFPDKYIRSVVIVGAAYKFYVTDEEGMQTAQQYQYDFLDGLYYMKRDYSYLIKPEYQGVGRGFLEGPAINSTLTTQWGGW